MSRPFQYVHAFIWTFLATILLAAAVSFGRRLYPDLPALGIGVSEALAYGGVSWLLFRVHGFAGSPLRFCGLRPTHPALFLLGLAAGVLLHGPAELLGALSEVIAPSPPGLLEEKQALFSVTSLHNRVLVVVVVTSVVPFVEELFFRGALYGALRRYEGPVVAASLSGLCFLIGHTNARVWLPLSVVAFSLSYLRARSGSLLPGLALHVGFNTVTVALATSGAFGGRGVSALGWPWLAVGCVLVPGVLFGAHKVAATSERARAARTEDVNG